MINLNDLYELQYKLDDYILSKQDNPPKDLLINTVVALLVEIGELANTTRCFKHWSNKGMMEREIVLDEFSDVLHFYLSIGNQVDETFKFKDNADIMEKDLTVQFLEIYSIITLLFIILFILVFVFRKKWIEKPLTRFLSKVLLNGDNKKDE